MYTVLEYSLLTKSTREQKHLLKYNRIFSEIIAFGS